MILQFLINYFKGVIVQGFILKIAQAFFTKEKVIGYVGGIIIAVVAAGLDMQPKVLRDTVCTTYQDK